MKIKTFIILVLLFAFNSGFSQGAQLLKFLFASEVRVATSAATKAVITPSARVATEMSIEQAINAGIASRKVTGNYTHIKNLYGGPLGLRLEEKDAESLLKELSLEYGNYRNVEELQKEFLLTKTGKWDEETNEVAKALIKLRNRHEIVINFAERKGLSETEKYLTKSNLKRKSDILGYSCDCNSLSKNEIIDIQNTLKFNQYYPGNVDGVFGDQTKKAAGSFLKNSGHTIDPQGLRAMMKIEKAKLNNALALAGFKGGNLDESIKLFQQYRGEIPSGLLSKDGVKALKFEIGYANEVKMLMNSNKTPYEYQLESKRLLSEKSNVAAFIREEGYILTLIENKTYPISRTELWSFDGTKMTRLNETNMYSSLIESHRTAGGRHLGKFKIVSIMPEKTSNKICFISNDKAVYKTEQEIADALESASWDDDFSLLDEFFPKLKEGEKERVIINRNIFDRAIKEIDGEVSSITEFRIDSEDLLHHLSRRYEKHYEFYLDDELNKAVDNLSNLPKLNSKDDIKIAFPSEGTFTVQDHGVINDLKENHLTNLFTEGITPLQNSNVILITGHKDDALRQFIEAHGKAGNLKGKALVVFSCYDVVDANYYSSLVKKYNAREIIYYPVKIKPAAVAEVIEEMLDNIPNQKTNENSSKYIHELLEESTQKAIGKPSNKLIKSDLEQMLRAIKQISSIQIVPLLKSKSGLC
jgi:peptidoglycan hydrolase-like protein with peptidoglycan-binding domain